MSLALNKFEGGKVKDQGQKPKKRQLSGSDSEPERIVNGDLGTSTPLAPHRSKHPRRLSTDIHHQQGRDRIDENMVVNGIDRRMLENGMKTPVVMMQRDPIATAMAKTNQLTTTSKRISIGAVPEHIGGDNATNNSPLLLINNDLDDEEIRRRRHLHRIAQRARVSGSPVPTGREGTPGPGRKSMGGQGTTQQLAPNQLKDYYGMCMKMSTENKIHGKTAFDLHLIDYISQLLQTQTDANRVDFKLASGALDLGAKIYCNRVDFVHTEAQKVASGLMLAADDKKKDAHTEAGEDGVNVSRDDDEEGAHEEVQKKRKKRERKRNARTIAQNIDSLNIAKVECNVETDPIFHRLAASFDMGVCNGALMSNLEMGPDGQLLIDSKTPRDSVPKAFYDHTSPMASISRFSQVLNDLTQNHDNVYICQPMSRFTFADREQQIEMEMGREAENENSNQNYAFDLHAELSDDDDQPVDDPPGDDIGDLESNDVNSNPDDTPGVQTRSRRSIIKAMNLEAMEDLIQLLSEDKPNEYAYFSKKVLDTWAGPNHWKVNRLIQLRDLVANARTPRRRKRKDYAMIDFLSDDHHYEPMSKRKLERLKDPTLRRWVDNAQNDVLPEMESFTLLNLARPFNRPESTYHCNDKTTDDMLEITKSDHNYFSHSVVDEPPMSPRGLSVDSDEDVAPPAGFGETDDGPLSQAPSTYDTIPFSDTNMVDVPFVLSDLNISYARVAKKIDVRKLKRAMWDTLIVPENQPEPPTPVVVEDKTAEKPKHMGSRRTDFIQVYETLPKKISPLMAANLSAPIAFVTLLHIANEKNLKLIGSDDLTDFLIEQEPPEEEELGPTSSKST